VTPHNTGRAAERQRAYRARKRDGCLTIRGDLSGEAVAALIAAGWIGSDEANDPVKLANAAALVAWWAGHVLGGRTHGAV